MNRTIYLDNAATTAVDPRVVEVMLPFLTEHYGNPSSGYALGRSTRSAIENARKKTSSHLGVSPTNIYFTSGGTESNNTAIASAVHDLKCTHIITSPTEHHAVLNVVAYYSAKEGITCSYVKLNTDGEVDMMDLQSQLETKSNDGQKCLVSLMHANNEIGTLLDLKKVSELCRTYQAVFHSDCVQTIGHYPIDLKECGVDFASASGHKFHGPKGTGILYVRDQAQFFPLLHGGGQERRKRAGTENVYGIIGFATALELAMENYESERQYIIALKEKMQKGLLEISASISFNGQLDGLYTVLSVNFPSVVSADLLLAQLDYEGICASGGSACSTGEEKGSHVIRALGKGIDGATLRFSFSKLTTESDIDHALASLSKILEPKTQAFQV